MALIQFEQIAYLPYLSVRPSEMRALHELPERDKGLFAPLFQLRPWGASHHLDNSLSRIEEAYGLRPQFLEVAPPEAINGARRPVHDALDELRDPSNGSRAWCEFVTARENIVPALQITDPANFHVQGAYLSRLGRGLLLRIATRDFANIDVLSRAVAQFTNGGQDVVVMIDFEKQARDILTRTAVGVGYAGVVRRVLPNAYVAFSASSFPESFTNIDNQDIYERQFFNGVALQMAGDRLLYSDRGSARAERQAGGGGTPAPRIDYALPNRWTFFRSDENGDRSSGYQVQARAAISSENWDPDLRLWGTQMIERTAAGDSEAIASAASSTAVRINIHLHRQLFYGDDPGLYDTDEDWVD